MGKRLLNLIGLLGVLAALYGVSGATAGAHAIPSVTVTATGASSPTQPAPAVSVPTPAPTTPTPKPPAPQPAVKASVRLYLRDLFFVHHKSLTVPRRALSAEGVVSPYVAGQYVRVLVRIGHHLFKSQRLLVKPSANRRYGVFSVRVSAPRTGIEHISARHYRSAQMLGFSTTRGVAVLDTHVHFGSTGRFVQLVQQRLEDLHFYIPQSGVYDSHTGLAVDAYHRLLGWGTSQSLGGATISALLDGRGSFHVRDPRDGKHVEGNLGKQLLALIYGKRVYRIYPISSGKPSTPTVLGHFKVYQRTPGYLPDGMYYSDFFYGGYAIHGFNPAPDYPASHGCMRLPISDAISVYNWLTYGNVVDVYQ
jgi:hypothetical protein